MATYVIELNDAGVRLATAERCLADSPGYALLQGDRLLLGERARSEARLHPRHIQSQFWSRLSTDALPQPGPRARTVADLAYAHLLDLFSDTDAADADVVFAVPGQFDRNQLALLLGIARECPFRAVGLVDMGVAAVAASGAGRGTALHVDGQLHRTVITRINVDDELVRDRVDDTAATGLIGLQDAMVGLIADAFIRETRFDPLHEAGTEQRLYDSLGTWLEQLALAGEALLELDTGRNSYRVSMHQDRLVERLRPRYEQLAERLRTHAGNGAEIHLSARLAELPGLQASLEARLGDCEVIRAADDAVQQGTFAHLDRIRRDGERLAFVTRLPNVLPAGQETKVEAPAKAEGPAAAPEPRAPEPEPPAPLRPTHVLLGHEAWPLGPEPLTIGGSDGCLPAELPQRVCTIRLQDGGIRIDPEYGASITHQGEEAERTLYLAVGEEILLDKRIALTPIVVRSEI
ncbi:MAG: hypothetical protein JJT88_11960 [Gammaproteobacteria bacterium]|nr:hypothetical protein [Gammaproteobacteria bacterium]